MNYKNYTIEPALTNSEKIVLDNKLNNPDIKVLQVERARGGWLLISYEKISVRKTDKHEYPFKYAREMYGKRGARLHKWSGNIWDDESKCIIDDFTEIKSSHLNGYKW